MSSKNAGRRSLVRRLQAAYALATLVIVGLLAIALDLALVRAFDEEDRETLETQAHALGASFATGRRPVAETWQRPDKVEWAILVQHGRPTVSSLGYARLDDLEWPDEASHPVERNTPSGRSFLVLVRTLEAGALTATLQLALDRTHEADIISQFRRLLWAICVLAVACAALAGRYITLRALRPLHEIAEKTRAVAPANLDRRLDADRFPVEMGELVETLNAMLARLEAAFARLGELGTNLAHELRAPLQNLRAEVESLVLRPPPPEVQRDTLGSLLEEFDRLAAMVEQILFLARSEDPRTLVRRELLDAREMLSQAAEFFEASADEAGVAIVVEVVPGLQLYADRTLLQRVLNNLLGNAVRHTPPGGRVTLTAERVGTEARLLVRDTGPGIPEAMRARVGERFLRHDPSRDRSTGGTGLGLAIVASIATLHGGRLTAGEAPGHGAELVVTFPHEKAPPPA